MRPAARNLPAGMNRPFLGHFIRAVNGTRTDTFYRDTMTSNREMHSALRRTGKERTAEELLALHGSAPIPQAIIDELIAAAINLKKYSDRGQVHAHSNKRFDDAVIAYQSAKRGS